MRRYLKNLVTNPLFSGSLIMVFGSNATSFINYLYHLIMGRILGPSGYGELASLIAITGLLGIIPGSFNLVIIKYISGGKDSKEINNLAKWFQVKVFKIALIFFVVILILSPFISSFLKISKVFYFWIIAISFLFSIQSLVNRAILQGMLRFKDMVLSLFVENGSKLMIGIILVYMGFQVEGAMLGYLLATFIGFYITNSYLKLNNRNIMEKYDPKIKSVLGFTVPVFIQSISTTSIYSSDVILVKHFFLPHDAGIYAALSTLGKIIFFGAGPIAAVMFPLVSQRKSKGEDFKKLFFYSFISTMLFAAVVSLFYFAYPKFAVSLLFGSAYLEASNLLIWFAVFIGLFTLSSLLINFGLSLGKTKIVIFPLFAAVIQIFLIILLHQALLTVVQISVVVNALLLLSLLIYLVFRKVLNEDVSIRDKITISNSTSL